MAESRRTSLLSVYTQNNIAITRKNYKTSGSQMVTLEEYGYEADKRELLSQSFGKFSITLSGKGFLLDYCNDRSFLRDNMNSDEGPTDSNTRIKELNLFLRKDFDLISDLYNDDIYADTLQKTEKLLKRSFNRKYPGMMK